MLEPPEKLEQKLQPDQTKPRALHQHASHHTRETTSKTGSGMKGNRIIHGNLINDSTMSGDAPEFIVLASEQIQAAYLSDQTISFSLKIRNIRARKINYGSMMTPA